jgi:hypothetical protein
MSSVFQKDVNDFLFNILKFTKTVVIPGIFEIIIFSVCSLFNYYEKHPVKLNTLFKVI